MRLTQGLRQHIYPRGRLEQSHGVALNRDFPGAFFVIVLRAIHARTHGILLHQAAIQRPQTVQNRFASVMPGSNQPS